MILTKTVEHAFPAITGRCLQLNVDNGRVRVQVGKDEDAAIHCRISLTAEAASDAEARALLERVDLAFEETGEGSILRSRIAEPGRLGKSRWWRRSGRAGRIEVDVVVTVPCRQDLVLKNGVGEIEIGRLEGNVDVLSGAGDIRIDAVQGEVRVEGGSGSIEVCNVSGRIVAKSGAGDITLRGAGGSIQVTTLAGEVSVEIVRQLEDGSRIATTAGGISIALAESAGLDLHSQTFLGKVALDVPAAARTDGRGGTVHALYGGGPGLNVSTMVGEVRIAPLSPA